MSLNERKKSSTVPKELPNPPDGWTRCHAYLSQKRRFCRQTVVPTEENTDGPQYCGNHLHLHQSGASWKRKRIPCPVDGSHLIYEDALEKHVAVCPATKRRRMQEQQPYYKFNVNAGGYGEMTEGTNGQSVEWAKQLALRVLVAYQRAFGPPTHSNNCRAVTFEQLQNAIPMMDFSKAELEAGFEQSVKKFRIRAGGSRHLIQQASLIGHLRRVGALPKLGTREEGSSSGGSKTCLLELGAGRGMLGLVAAGSATASNSGSNLHLVLVERAGGARGKAETILRNSKESIENESNNYLTFNQFQWTRIQCDLAHVYLPTVMAELTPPGETGEGSSTDHRVVAIAKHLCGAGTDLALRSLGEVASHINACVMATCCHGICTWDNYVGRDFLCQLMKSPHDESPFGREEFELMRRWTSGTVLQNCKYAGGLSQLSEQEQDDAEHSNDTREPDNIKDPFTVSSIVEATGLSCGVQGLGRACQRLFDYGRCQYMEHVLFRDQSSANAQPGFKVELCHYTSSDVTPQNAALVAYRVPPSAS